MGVKRQLLPENLNEFFGIFGSDRQNVIKSCAIARLSPLIGPKVPVHGLLVDIQTGKLEWLVNGYQAWATMSDKWNEVVRSAGETVDKLKSLTDFNIGEMKFPETKIGETVVKAEDWLSQKIGALQTKPDEPPAADATPSAAANIAQQVVHYAEKHLPKPAASSKPPPKIPLPPPLRVRPNFPPRGKK